MNPTHSKLSPSKRARWRRCPGSAQYPDTERAGPAAIDGTHTHTLVERCTIAGLADPLSMIGITLEDHEGQFTVDADRAQRAKVMIDYLRERQKQLGGMGIIQAETKVDPARLIGRPDMSGTFDAMIVGGGVCEIIDYKDGMGAVIAERNEQLEQYAVGVLAEHPTRPYPFEEIWLTVVQPKLASKGGAVIDTWKTTVEDIMNRVVPALQREGAATDDPNAPIIAGDVQCKFCPAKGFCPVLAATTLNNAGITFPSIEAPMEIVEQAASKDPTTMDAAQIVKILEAAPLLKSMIAAVEEEAQRRLESGQSIPGLKLVAGRGSRRWALDEEKIEQALKTMGVPKSAMWVTSLVSPAQAEKLVWENRKGERKSLSAKQRSLLAQEYTAKMAGRPQVALASDDRPAIVLDASPLFGAVEAPQPATPVLPDWLTG